MPHTETVCFQKKASLQEKNRMMLPTERTPALLDALISAYPSASEAFVACARLGALSTAWRDAVLQYQSTAAVVELSGHISIGALHTVARRCAALETLRLSQRSSLSDPIVAAGVRHRMLHSTDLESCGEITDDAITDVARNCPRLQSIE